MNQSADGAERGEPCSSFKKLDFFGQHIRLTFKDKEMFQTYYGAFVSVLCACAMVLFFVMRTQKMVT